MTTFQRTWLIYGWIDSMPIEIEIALAKMLFYAHVLEVIADQFKMDPRDMACKCIANGFYRKYSTY